MEKYYTPTIDEFYIGYEYEYLSTSYSPIIVDHTDDTIEFSEEKYEIWKKQILEIPKSYQPDGVLEYLSALLSNKQIRTKYLDREDILDLGFTEESYFFGVDEKYYQNNKFYLSQNKNLTWSITDVDTIIYYYGNIKSKNELKTILKFLNVN